MKKRKFRSAAEKRSYISAMNTEFGIAKKRKVVVSAVNGIPKMTVPPGRETPYYPSVGLGVGNGFARDVKTYTGTKMLGIGTLHKSNAVPVFNDDEAKDIASMRR